ncbi:MAG TPA: DUF2314 domain-containing protein [Longimicrobiaceae bacterium]
MIIQRAVRLAGVATMLALTAGCRGNASRRADGRASPPSAVRAPEPPPDAATLQARATVGLFLRFLTDPWSTQQGATVQVRVESGAGPRLVWLEETRYDGRYITGMLSEDALPDRHRGDAVRVRPSEISDWLAEGPGVLCGRFSERRRWERLPAAEREKMLQNLQLERLPSGDEVCVENYKVTTVEHWQPFEPMKHHSEQQGVR